MGGGGGGGGITSIRRKMGFKDCEYLIWSIIKFKKMKSRTRGIWAVEEQHVMQHKMPFEIRCLSNRIWFTAEDSMKLQG